MLMRGSSGDNVTLVQGMLTEAGLYEGRVDGQFGPKTERAVTEWQRFTGSPATGVWDIDATIKAARMLNTFTDAHGRAVVPTIPRSV